MRDEFVDFLGGLCRIESPTEDPAAQASVHAYLEPALRNLGYRIRIVPGRSRGSHLLAVPEKRERGRPCQLMLGHSDTVWPQGTLARMPVREENGRLFGPGTFDMKGGVTLMIFALRALRRLDLHPQLTPILFINADEEVGSPESKRHVRRIARRVHRTLVLEPSQGPKGLIKTARKGVGNFEVTIVGRAAHAGLDPTAGASAITELAHVIRRVNELNDPERGRTLNVGVVRGGTRPNVIAAEAHASIDVRVTTGEDGAHVTDALLAMAPLTPGVRLEITGGIRAAPLERTPRNRRLWSLALEEAKGLDLDLEETTAGGGSDGNTTSLFTATLDGLGCVGDGAHADHEHIVIDASLDRCALLARLLLTPA
jgi:glutamate carboxypeptidase